MASPSSSCSTSASKKKITLKSSDGKLFEVEEKVAIQSQTIKQMLEDVSSEDEIPLPNVTGKVLAKVIEFCSGNSPDLPSFGEGLIDEDYRNDWQSYFLKVDQDILFDIILAANYLDIKSLLDMSCKCVANMMEGKTLEQIREKFNIVNDYTAEEEEKVRAELSWAFH